MNIRNIIEYKISYKNHWSSHESHFLLFLTSENHKFRNAAFDFRKDFILVVFFDPEN